MSKFSERLSSATNEDKQVNPIYVQAIAKELPKVGCIDNNVVNGIDTDTIIYQIKGMLKQYDPEGLNNQATTPPDTTDPTGGYGNIEDTPSNTSSEAPVTDAEVKAALDALGLTGDDSEILSNGNPREWGPQLEENSHLDWQ